MGGHGRGRKRLRYQFVEGHRFAYKRKGLISRGQLSLCGQTLEAASASEATEECSACKQAAAQLWA